MKVIYQKDLGYYPETISNFAISAGGGGFDNSNDKILNIDEMVEAFEINKLKTSFSELNFEKLEQFNKSLFKSYLENSPNVLLKEMSEHLTEKFGHVPVSDTVLLKIVELERINKVSDLTTNPDLQFIWQRSKICAFFLALSLSYVSGSS